MLEPAPGRLSTTIGWPSVRCERLLQSARDTRSAAPPGAKPTTRRIGPRRIGLSEMPERFEKKNKQAVVSRKGLVE